MVAESKRVVAYTRVSTDQQAEHGGGLQYQQRAIEVWCDVNGMELVTTCRDQGVSGAEPMDDRQGLPIAMAFIAQGVADGIVVWKLDRLARDVVLQETILRDITRKGGRLYSTHQAEQETLDEPNEPQRQLIRVILGAIASYESAMVRSRMMAGKRLKSTNGGYIGGPTPFGTQNGPDGELEPNEDEVVTLRRMVELREQGLGYLKIANALNAEGLSTRSGSPWQPTTIRTILLRVAPTLVEYKGRRVGRPGAKKYRKDRPAKLPPPKPAPPVDRVIS
jgi:DNA invertase Pin-like site-specific DNA recombinase